MHSNSMVEVPFEGGTKARNFYSSEWQPLAFMALASTTANVTGHFITGAPNWQPALPL